RAAGMSVPECFRVHGEAHFRELEHQAIGSSLIEHDGVLALGGGAVLDPRTRSALAAHRVVHLEVSDTEALARLRGSGERPLLADDPAGRLAALRAEREPLYTEVATATIDTTGRTVEHAVEDIAALLPTRIPVRDGDGGYDVLIGSGLTQEVVRAAL